MSLINAVKKAWNVFNRDPTRYQYNTGPGYSFRPDRVRFSRGNERSIVTSVYNRIALDVAALNIRHVLLDDEKRYKDEVNDGLNTCLSLEANIDQTGRSFIQDAVMSMMDEGWDSYWEDGDGWCYGNYLEDKLINAGIAFDSYYADPED